MATASAKETTTRTTVKSIGSIFVQIFNEYPSLTKGIDYRSFTFKDHIKELSAWLNAQLQDVDVPESVIKQMVELGCLGPTVKMFDIKGESAHTVNVSKDWLTLQSQTAFSTIKANCCVYKGKWMYEVQLRSKGIMQIGYCSAKCRFTQDTGVGDTRNSYGLDGSKQRLWHVQTRKYGPYWRSGDVFGVCLDMDAGIIEYHRNGKALGEAFTGIERGAGFALFPGVSMAYNDCLTANFGGSPFRHPVAGYEPMQARPTMVLRHADFLLKRTIALSQEISMNHGRDIVSLGPGMPSASAVHMVVGGLLIGRLSSFLVNTYVIEDLVFSYVKSLCVMRSTSSTEKLVYPGSPPSTLGTFLTLLWAYLDSKDIKMFIGRFVMFLSSLYRETPSNLEYEKQRTVIVILTCLCHHPKTRKYLLEFRFFKKNFYNAINCTFPIPHSLPVFVYIKPPDESTLAELLPDDHVWTEGIGGKKNLYMAGCVKLKKATDALYVLQKHLVELLLINDDDEKKATPSSFRLFVHRMRRFVLENCLEHRQSTDFLNGNRGTPTQPAVALSFICLVLDVLCEKYTALKEDAIRTAFVRPISFYDGSLYYSFYERLGGVVSHLSKVFNQELLDRIGADGVMSVVAGAESRPIIPSDISIYSAMFMITGGSGSNATLTDESPQPNNAVGIYVEQPNHRTNTQPFQAVHDLKKGPIDHLHALDDLLDCCIIYYYGVAHKYVIMIAELRDNIGTLSDILIDTKTAFDDVKKTIATTDGRPDASINAVQDEILKELNEKFDNRRNVFHQRSVELARKQVWYRSVALGDRRQNLLHWMLSCVFNTLTEATKDGVLFAFVPEIYVNILPILLDTSLDFSHHDLAREYDQSAVIDVLKIGAEFLGGHSADPQIILASSKDALLQALGTMACHEEGVRTLEQITSESQIKLVQGLLRPYENRAWGQSNWMLNRFWMGDGFGYRDVRAPSMWQSESQQTPNGLLRSRGKIGAHTGLLHHVAPACPSRHYHELIADVLMSDEPFSTIFVNSILSQLNWAFSEFIQLLQEIQNNVQRHDQRHFSETRQLKICSMCFELTVSLMRSLEMLLSIVPGVFKDPDRPNSDLLLNRVCQLISQALARVTVPPGVFQFVVDLCLPDLSTITHFAVVSAAIGILIALLSDEMKPSLWSSPEALIKIPRITRILLSDPSFQVAHLQFTLGDVVDSSLDPTKPTLKGNFDPQTRVNIDPLTNEVRVISSRLKKPNKPIIKFNLQDYTTHVSAQEIITVKQMIDFIDRHKSLLSDTSLPSDDTLCPICYAKSVSATFLPCKHQSCANCIVQHLMNNKVCFYCKAHITSVQNFNGISIYDQVDNLPPVPHET